MRELARGGEDEPAWQPALGSYLVSRSREQKKKASAEYVDRSGRARKKYPRDGLEIFWNHTNIHRKYRIDSAIFILLPPPQFPPFNILIDVT
jgi:hypothetical protein